MHLREFSSDKYSSLTQLLALNLNLIFPTARSGIIFLIIIVTTITIILTISTDHTAVAIIVVMIILFLITTIVIITITIIMTICTDHTAVAILEKKLERHAMFNRGRPEPSSGKNLFGTFDVSIVLIIINHQLSSSSSIIITIKPAM